MRVEVVQITPAMARELLKQNLGNRPCNERDVEHYASLMMAGKWLENGDTITISKSGRVLDGQHRLHAISRSGVTVKTVMVYGVDDIAFHSKDCGRRRSPADTLAIAGVKNCNHVAAALVLIDRYYKKRVYGHTRYTNEQILGLLEVYPEVASLSTLTRKPKIIPASVLNACNYIFSRIDPEQAQQFVDDLLEGAELSRGDAVLLLRTRLLENVKIRTHKIAVTYTMALAIKAWNFRRRGLTDVKYLRMRLDGDHPEEFPEAI